MDDKIWTRRDGESPVAHAAFKEYLRQGDDRSLVRVGEALGKSTTLMERWSSAHDWPARSVAYDQYTLAAVTDGEMESMAAKLSECRDKNLALMDKLRGHLETRLDTFIARGEDPTIRWTQALTAMAKVEQNSLLLKDDAKTTEKLDNVMELVEKMISNANRAPA